MSELFTGAYTWDGGYYQLAIELGARSDERLQAALETIWQFEELDGCYVDREVEPSHQSHISPTLETGLMGVATLPGGKRVACGTGIVREDSGRDWIYFYLPMGTLNTAYDVGAYPFIDGKSSRSWREPLDDWLAQIAVAVYASVPYSLALIGLEVSGDTYIEELQRTGIPEERWMGYLWQRDEHLVWYPPTNYDGDYAIG